MSSINTNAGAMTALQTLKATNKNLEATQGRISTGYAVSEAAHNAAYWSIATTMRSDNNAMSTVKDALGLGAAQVDIAYTAMDAVKDTLDNMKKKLVAASQPDIDKAKIQEEIVQLQNDLKTFAKSATFSGGNWLEVAAKGEQKVVASFIRDASNGVSLETISIDTGKTALFVTGGSDEKGLLQTNADLTTGVPDVASYSQGSPTALAASIAQDFTFAGFADNDWIAGDTASFTVAVTGGTATTINVTAAYNGTDWTFTQSTAGAADSVTLGFSIEDGDLVVNAANGHATDSRSVQMTQFASSRSSGVDVSNLKGVVAAAAAGAATLAIADANKAAWAEGDTFSFDLNNHDTPAQNTRATFTYDGSAWVAGDNVPAGITLVAAGNNLNVGIVAASPFADATDLLSVKNFSSTTEITVTDFDINTLERPQIQALMSHVDKVLGSVTTAASDLGAIKTRISSQSDFVGKIMDAVSRGVGQLVDADMEAESARLQALQVQQQLGIQALSIANSNTQNILSLFR